MVLKVEYPFGEGFRIHHCKIEEKNEGYAWGVSRKFYPSATTCTRSATHTTGFQGVRVDGVIALLR